MGTLSIVATPIGNMEDVTLRALRVLKEADAIYAEDTRIISKLLARFDISNRVYRLDAATEGKKAREVIARLSTGERIAFVSDAGTPGISDPGARLVAAVRTGLPEATIEAIPGASALAAALSIAGLSDAPFTFLGFLPHKKGRQTALKEIAASPHPVVLYESPHRVLKLLAEIAVVAPQARVGVARELTKVHEEYITGAPQEVATSLEERNAVRGEFVVIIEPRGEGY